MEMNSRSKSDQTKSEQSGVIARVPWSVTMGVRRGEGRTRGKKEESGAADEVDGDDDAEKRRDASSDRSPPPSPKKSTPAPSFSIPPTTLVPHDAECGSLPSYGPP